MPLAALLAAPLLLSRTLSPEQVVRAAEVKGFAGIAGYSREGTTQFIFAGGGRASERFPICSVTKLFTAVLVLRQIDRGLLKLDDCAADRLPELRSVLGETTVLDLLTHASTLTNMDDAGTKDAEGIAQVYRERRMGDHEPMVTASRFARKAPVEPGARFSYNNMDFIVLAALVERVTGASYATLIQREFARPLGLRDTGVLELATLPRDVRRSARPPLNFAVYSGAGAMVSSVRDLLAFGRAVMHGPLLSSASRERLLSGEPRFGYIGPGTFRASIAVGGRTLRVIDRPGAIGDYALRYEIAPEAKTVAVVFTADGTFDLGRVYEGRGLSYDFLLATLSQ